MMFFLQLFAFIIVNYRMKHPLSERYYLDYVERREYHPEYKMAKRRYYKFHPMETEFQYPE
jgi:hypothetical protein